jgi:hypothetical protein
MYQVHRGDNAIELTGDSEKRYTFDVSSRTLLFQHRHAAIRAFPGRYIVYASSDEHANVACRELNTWKKQNTARSWLIKEAGQHRCAVQTFLHMNNRLDTQVVHLEPPVGYKEIMTDAEGSTVHYKNTPEMLHGFIFDVTNNIQTEFMMTNDTLTCWDMNLDPPALAVRTRHMNYLWDKVTERRRGRGQPVPIMPPINIGYPAANQ